MADIFLSYSHRDRELAEQLAQVFRQLGVSVWWDQRLLPGEPWSEAIADALAQTDAAVLLVTPASLESASARDEWQRAKNFNTFPVRRL
jgi:nucleotide-binding universal stress UspA family protein